MPSIVSPSISSYSSPCCKLGPPRDSPPPDVCARVNNQVHSNPALACTTFDFAAHVQNRSYVMHNFFVGEFEGTALLDAGVKDLLPDSFEPVDRPPVDTFEIAGAGKKGLGMFASRGISTGDIILVEHPVVIVPYLIGLAMPLSELYAELFNRLPAGTLHELMSLTDGRSQEEGTFLEGIFRMNAIGVQLDVPEGPHPELPTHRAIFLSTSRCNHSCGPNAKWEWDLDSFSLYLSAVRPILQGEEITVSYTILTRPQFERQTLLHSLYGFTCKCDYCHLPSVSSDRARADLDQIWSKLPVFEQWCLDASMPDNALIDIHIQALQLIEQEGLQVLDYEKHIDAIAMCYGALEDVAMFRAWTGRVRDMKVRTNPSQAIVFAKWLSNPISFPAWGWRKTFCGSRAAA